MPVDTALIAARLGKPGDLRHSVTDRDQTHPTVLAATQANSGDLTKGHVDHAANSQPVFPRLPFPMGESLCGISESVQPLLAELDNEHSNFRPTLRRNLEYRPGYTSIFQSTSRWPRSSIHTAFCLLFRSKAYC